MRIVTIVTTIALAPTPAFGQELTVEDLYNTFNMRTILSSFGQRLKYYCQSYPADFFAQDEVTMDQATKTLTLSSGNDLWEITILSDNAISVVNQLRKGTYNSYSEYSLHYDREAGDWRADKTFIARDKDCVDFRL